MYYRNRKGIKIWALRKRSKFGSLIDFKDVGIVNFPFEVPEGMFDSIVTMPSKKKLAQNFSKQVSKKVGVPVLKKSVLKKTGKVSVIPVNLRHMKAESMFRSGSVSGNVLLVDDYSTTGASIVSAAKELLRNGAKSVTGFCVVIS
jgi:phosphoribosylpyrophosphate synthetase